MPAFITAAHTAPQPRPQLHGPALSLSRSTRILAVSVGGHALVFFPAALLTDQGPKL